MMIELPSGYELVFRPFSDTDQRLRAELKLRNPHGDRSMVFKVHLPIPRSNRQMLMRFKHNPTKE